MSEEEKELKKAIKELTEEVRTLKEGLKIRCSDCGESTIYSKPKKDGRVICNNCWHEEARLNRDELEIR